MSGWTWVRPAARFRPRTASATSSRAMSAGRRTWGGAITIVITGHQRIESIKMLPEVIDADDPEMLGDLLVAAVNNAIEQSQLMASRRLQGLTGGLNIPGLGG